jgi:arylsulfatase A-like enzyme
MAIFSNMTILLLSTTLALAASTLARGNEAKIKVRSSSPLAMRNSRPNVVIILADDMGNGDVSSYGGSLVETKYIDSIGRDGVIFTDAYVSAPLCSPSRAGLLTGRYQQRFGFEQQVSSGAFPELREVRDENGKLTPLQGEEEFLRRGIPIEERNIGEIFKSGGYVTGVIGKWHVGHAAQFQPQNRGFDYSNVFYGNTSLQMTDLSNPDFISLKVDFHDEAPLTAWTRAGLNSIRENGKLVEVNQYLLNYFRDRAVQFIEDNKSRPFMLYLPMNSPVPPLQVPVEYFEKLRKSIPKIDVRAYNALLLAQDEAVGAVLNKLKEAGLDKNTIVVFLSDNGEALSRPGSNAPYSAGKYSTHEGGIRVPYMIKWPGHIPSGSVYRKPVISLDILPTVAAAADVSSAGSKQLDGVNLLPFIGAQSAGSPHEVLFWKLGEESAVRMDKWKLWINNKTGQASLFDLNQDVAENNDLSAQYPLVKADLRAKFDDWNASLPPRSWTNISPVFGK